MLVLLRVSAWQLRSLLYMCVHTTLKTPFSFVTSPLQLINTQTLQTIDRSALWHKELVRPCAVQRGIGGCCLGDSSSGAQGVTETFVLGHGANTHMHRPMCILLVNETLQKSPGAVTQSICSFSFDNRLLLTLTAFSSLNFYLFSCFLDHRPEWNQSQIWPQRTGICHQNTPAEIGSLFFLPCIRGLQHSGHFKPFSLCCFTWEYSPISFRSVLDNTA